MSEHLKQFCKTKDPTHLHKMDNYTKKLFIAASSYCLTKNVGKQDIAKIVKKEIGKWEYSFIPKGTILYRGTKTIPDEKDWATYYALDIDVANMYLPVTKDGYLNVYKVKHDLALFKLDSLPNANNVLKQTFEDKDIVYTHGNNKKVKIEQTIYDLIRSFYTGELVPPKETKPIHLKRLLRNSVTNKDLIISNWLCEQGFDGYKADVMIQRSGHTFPAEVMLCKPTSSVKLLESIKMKKIKSNKILQNVVDKYSI
jgi:hypothetical protein